MSGIWEMSFQFLGWLTCWFISILYKLAFPAYVILDSLANNLNDLRIIALIMDLRRGVTQDDAAKVRGISLDLLNEDLAHASQLSDGEIEKAILTALSIVLGILALVVMFIRYIFG